MPIGKSHKVLPDLMHIHEALTKAHLLSCQLVAQPDTNNAIELRIAIEAVQYQLDLLGLKYAKENV